MDAAEFVGYGRGVDELEDAFVDRVVPELDGLVRRQLGYSGGDLQPNHN